MFLRVVHRLPVHRSSNFARVAPAMMRTFASLPERRFSPFDNLLADTFGNDRFFNPFDDGFFKVPERAMGEFVRRTQGLYPSLDIKETKEAYVFQVDLPGIGKDDLSLKMDGDGILTLSGKRKKEEISEEESFKRIERSYGSFSRSFQLPENADANAIDAKFENGELILTIKKKEPTEPETKTIKIS